VKRPGGVAKADLGYLYAPISVSAVAKPAAPPNILGELLCRHGVFVELPAVAGLVEREALDLG